GRATPAGAAWEPRRPARSNPALATTPARRRTSARWRVRGEGTCGRDSRGGSYLTQRRIKRAERRVAFVHHANRRRVGARFVGDADERLADLVNRSPDAGADARQQGRAVRRAFIRGDRLHRLPVDVRLDPAPQRRPRAAAAEAN